MEVLALRPSDPGPSFERAAPGRSRGTVEREASGERRAEFDRRLEDAQDARDPQDAAGEPAPPPADHDPAVARDSGAAGTPAEVPDPPAAEDRPAAQPVAAGPKEPAAAKLSTLLPGPDLKPATVPQTGAPPEAAPASPEPAVPPTAAHATPTHPPPGPQAPRDAQHQEPPPAASPGAGKDPAPAPGPVAREVAQPSAPAGAAQEAAPRAEVPARAEAAPPPGPAAEAPAPRAAEILRQMRLQLSPQLRQATLRLEPEALGRIEVRVSVSGGRASADLRVESEATLAVLQRHVPELRAALEQSGLGGGELSLAWQQPRHRGGDRPETSSASASAGAHERRAAPAQLMELARAVAAASGIDTYA